MADIKAALTEPLGPLPRFAWVLVIVGGYFGYKFISGRSGGSSTTSTTATTTGASAAGGGVAPSSSDYAALTSQVSTLGNQITDLGSKISQIPPVDTLFPITPPVDNPTPPITPPVLVAPPVNDPIFPVAPVAPPTLVDTITLANDSAIRLLTFFNGGAQTIVPTARSYIVKATTYVGDPTTADNGLTKAYVVQQDGQDMYLLARNAAGDITQAPAIQDLTSIAAQPEFSNNTATPTPVSSSLNMVSSNYVSNPSIPTFSTEYVPATSFNIPATTPSN